MKSGAKWLTDPDADPFWVPYNLEIDIGEIIQLPSAEIENVDQPIRKLYMCKIPTMGKNKKMKYFAYGSNMLAERLLARIPADNPVRYALEGYRIRFHKHSTDGSGKCNAICTDQPLDVVHGVIFDVSENHISVLDKFEGVGYGYVKKQCRFLIDDDESDVLMYVAGDNHIDDALIPYNWYLELVISGAMQNGLPRDYISGLSAMPFTRDPKPDRKSRLEAIEALRKYNESL